MWTLTSLTAMAVLLLSPSVGEQTTEEGSAQLSSARFGEPSHHGNMMAMKALMVMMARMTFTNDAIDYFDALSDHQCLIMLNIVLGSKPLRGEGGAQLNSATQIWRAIPCWLCKWLMAVKTLMEDDIYHDDGNEDIDYFDAVSDHQVSQCLGANH